MAKVRNFPPTPPLNYVHEENGRSWKYVEPGMWKSIGSLGSTGRIEWDAVEAKPVPIEELGYNHEVVGGSYTGARK